MRMLQVVFFLIFFFFTSSMVTSKDNCSYSRCNDSIRVQFPFSFEDDQQKSCGYPGFNLVSCNIMNKTVIKLGSWGEFLVRDINYATQEVILHDQDYCLRKRLMNMDLTNSPSKAVMVPTLAPIWKSYEYYGYNGDLRLVWNTPSCPECVQRGGKCEFKNSKSSDIICFDQPRRRGLPKAVKYALSIGVGIPTLMCVILVACYICGRCKTYNGNNHNFRHRNIQSSSLSAMPQAPILVVGLGETVIQSYPKTVLGESRRLAKPDDNVCSICLSEYQAKDTLKTIPSCKHCFHANCIDEWLRRNVTCPLCRNAPMPISLPPPLAAP